MLQIGRSPGPARLIPVKPGSLRRQVSIPISTRVCGKLLSKKPSSQVAASQRRQGEESEEKRAEVLGLRGGLAAGCISTVLFGSLLLCGDLHAETGRLRDAGVSGPMRERIEEIVLDEVSTRIRAMSDEDLAKILEDLLRPSAKTTKEEFSPTERNASKDFIEPTAVVERAFEEDDDPSSTPSGFPGATNKEDRENLEETNSLDTMVDLEAPSPVVPDKSITVDDVLEQIREQEVAVEPVYQKWEEVLIDLFSRFGDDPVRLLKVAKGVAVGTLIVVPILWGPQVLQWIVRSEDAKLVENKEAQGLSDSVESVKVPPKAASPENNSSAIEVGKGSIEQEKETQKFPLWIWGWNKNREESVLKDANVDGRKLQAADDKQASTMLSTAVPVDNVNDPDARDSVRTTENLTAENTLWVREEADASVQPEDSADDGNILWRRDEAEDGNKQDSLAISDMDRVFVVEDASSIPTVSTAEWKPKVWPDPWLATTSVDNSTTLEANYNLKSYKAGNGTAMSVDPVAPHSTSSDTEPLSTGDADNESEKGENDRDDIWKPDQVEENLLSNVDTPNRFSAARIWGFVTSQSRSS